ncbi:epidermal differentiation-specific protein-like [Pimephales promelas]|uniref:epidermal differentiation-specific protein-like n=1 Tax=Pimephales promelas TaxID=90988 RepID=UPI00195598E9|nr:epidermal differentiation-specific protein-like [Pimephales promelas]
MSKIIVYSLEGFGGRSAEFNNDVGDLEANGFNNTIASLKVIGQPWVGYYDKDFAGKQRVFEAGEYPRRVSEDKGKFSSLKKITNDLSNPEIQLFEHINYQGRSVTLRGEINLTEIDFNDKASSHKVRGGVWVLYEHINRKGAQLVSFPGDRVSNYVPLSFNDTASSVRPLLPRP